MIVDYNLSYKITYEKPDGSFAHTGATWFEPCKDIDEARRKTEVRLNKRRQELIADGFKIVSSEGTYFN